MGFHPGYLARWIVAWSGSGVDMANPTPRVLVIGSGIVGTALIQSLVSRGIDVVLFEKGRSYPFPPTELYQREVLFEDYRSEDELLHPDMALPSRFLTIEQNKSYPHSLASERLMVLGGSATRWSGITLRMNPTDFQTRSRFGFGVDWPITYAELEPWYGKAEVLIGVSGTDEDNPFAPPRSTPFPLPAFALRPDDYFLGEGLSRAGLYLHTTPQARTSLAYDGRPECQNYGVCWVCPIGARYSPVHHLKKAETTGRLTIHTEVSVRRVVPGPRPVLVWRGLNDKTDQEASGDAIIVAAGAIESVRLLLLSQDGARPLGNHSGHLGKHLLLHHVWAGHLEYDRDLFPGQVGYFTGQSQQFVNPEGRGRKGGIKIELSTNLRQEWRKRGDGQVSSGKDMLERMKVLIRRRPINFHAESDDSEYKYVELGSGRDPFGDAFARVNYQSTEFDMATHQFARELMQRVQVATGASHAQMDDADQFWSGAHHMGGCRMSVDPAEGVVDRFGEIHGCPGVFVLGGSTFPTSSPVNRTLTMVALALRTADYLQARLLA